MKKFRDVFIQMFNNPCQENLQELEKECKKEKEKKEFYELKKKFSNISVDVGKKEGRKSYDRMRRLGKKYDLVYKKSEWLIK